jgi:hypothetical protein
MPLPIDYGVCAMKHQTISFVKSGIRIVGYLYLIPVSMAAAAFLVASELVGIWEEIGQD